MDSHNASFFQESADVPSMVALTVIVNLWGFLSCAAMMFCALLPN